MGHENLNIKETANSDLGAGSAIKPPLELMPKKFHDERVKVERFNEVCGAIARYYDAGPDALAFEENIGVNAIISIKSTRAQRLDKYFYDACNLDYLMKDAMYMDVASKVTGRDFSTTINIVQAMAELVLYTVR